MTVRARTSRVILLSDYAALQNPGGIIVPPAIATNKRVSSTRNILWAFTDIEFPDDEQNCVLTHITYEGSGEWCGFPAFQGSFSGISRRFLNLSLNGIIYYLNGDTAGPQGPISWSTHHTTYSGTVSRDPEDGCSQAGSLAAYFQSNGPQPLPAWGWIWDVDWSTQLTNPTVSQILAEGGQLGHQPLNSGFLFSGTGVGVAISETVKRYSLDTGWFITIQAGSHRRHGVVEAEMSNEHTLFDQMVLDGNEVTPTRKSELFSYDDDLGTYSGSLSAFSFVKPDELNVDGATYTVVFRVSVTDGIDAEIREVFVEYVGTGIPGESLTIPIPPEDGKTVEFVGECIGVSDTVWNGDDFQRIATSPYSKDAIPGWERWADEGWFRCGRPSTISADDFQEVAPRLENDGGEVILGTADTGHCWGADWWFGSNSTVECYDDFQAKNPATETTLAWLGGVGWAAPGWFGNDLQPQSEDDFQTETAGPALIMQGGRGWGDNGWFGEESQQISQDDFETQSAGAATTWTSGTGWGDDGWIG